MLWPKNLTKKIKTNVKLADFTSFKIGGPVKYYFEPGNLRELKEVLLLARRGRIKVFILGSGSNLLVSDRGLNGLVIKLTAKDFKDIYVEGTCIIAGSGLKLSQLILFAQEKGLSGLEFLSGIPGTLGGSLSGNAGAWGHSIGELVKQVYLLDYRANPKIINCKDAGFAYRKSGLGKYIIISATLRLKPENKRLIALNIREYLLKRAKAQNNRLPNAGCIFKNPLNSSAGSLIDRCGLKGKSIGGASVSKAHANFILNTGKAKSSEVSALMNSIKEKVKSRFGINLRPEIKIWK